MDPAERERLIHKIFEIGDIIGKVPEKVGEDGL